MRVDSFFYALEVADTGSFSQAARNLYISQPNISYAIKQLEEETGTVLFRRTSGGVVPTEKGREFIEIFRIIKREYDQVDKMAKNPNSQPKISLTVATLNCHRTIKAFLEISRQYISFPINFSFQHYASLDVILPMVKKGQVDFAIIGTLSSYGKTILQKLENEDIEYNLIAKAELCALVGKNNPLYYGKNSVCLKDLYPYPSVQYRNIEHDPCYSLSYELGLTADCAGVINVTNNQLFYDIIASTTAVGISTKKPDGRVDGTSGEIRRLSLEDCALTAEFGWIKLKRLQLSDIAQQLLDILKKYF